MLGFPLLIGIFWASGPCQASRQPGGRGDPRQFHLAVVLTASAIALLWVSWG